MGLMKTAFQVQGLNLERLMNLLQKENLPLWRLRRVDSRTLTGVCRARDAERIQSLCGEKGWRYVPRGKVGLAAMLERLRRRPGLVIGAVLAVVLLCIATRFVWLTRIQGAGPYRADIAQYLRENGLGPGVPIRQVDARDLETRLTLRYPKIAWFRVYVSGMTLVVDVTQGRPGETPPSAAPGDLVACRDGVVKEIRVYAGTAAVKPGDVVRRGQVLIRGQERGRDESITPVRAEGVVLARCWKQVIVETPLLTTRDMETGRETTVHRLESPWLCWPSQLETPEYLQWNTYISTQPLGGCFFPLWRKTVTYREVSLEYAMPDQQQLLRETRLAAEKRLREALRGYEIIDKWEDYCMIEDEKLSVSMTGEWVMDIGQEANETEARLLDEFFPCIAGNERHGGDAGAAWRQ